jgi:ABC-type phosphate transport system auxiliary subunit
LEIVYKQNEEISRLRAELHRNQNIGNGSPEAKNNFKLERVELQRQLTSLQAQFELVKAERDQAIEILRAISRTRTYKFLRHLKRWQWMEIPDQSHPTQTIDSASPRTRADYDT